jgi:hypothetical protein
MALYLVGVVNANGLEIAAAVCLWATSAAVATGADGRRLLVRMAVAFIVLVNLRSLSIAFGLAALALPFALADRTRLASLARRSDMRRTLLACVLGLVPAVAWNVKYGSPYRAWWLPSESVGKSFRDSFGSIPGMVGEFGGIRPRVAILLWLAVVVGLVGFALVGSTWRMRTVLLALLAAVVVVPVVIQSRVMLPIGALWYGRYALPLAAGLPILATFAPTAATPRVWFRAAALPALATAGMIAFVLADRRYAVGAHGPLLYLTDPVWGSSARHALPIAVCALALSALTVMLMRFTRAEERPRLRASTVCT